MAKVIGSNQAVEELSGIVAYLRTRDSAVAGSAGAALYALGESLADFPHLGRPASGGTREIVSVAPYVLRYRVDADRVLILRIRHGRQRPLNR